MTLTNQNILANPGDPTAVTITAEAYALFDTLRCIHQGKQEIADGKGRPFRAIFAEIEQKAKELQA